MTRRNDRTRTLQSYNVAKLQSCNVAKLQCCKVAKMQSCKVANISLKTQLGYGRTYVRRDRWASWAAVAAKNSLRYAFAICFWNFLCTESCKLCTFHLNLFNLNFRNISNLNYRNLSNHNSRNLSNIYCKSIGPETYYKSLRNKQSFQYPWWPLPRKGNPLLMTRRNDRTLTLMNLNTWHMTDTWHLTHDTISFTH